MTDGAGGIESRLETLAAAVMKQTEQVAEMRGTMRSFIDFELAAKQRLEIRVETEAMVEKSTEALSREIMSSRGAIVGEAKSELRAYTDSKITELEARFAAQEERDSKREGDMQRQQIALAGMAAVAVIYLVVQVIGGA